MRDRNVMIVIVLLVIVGIVYYLNHHQVKMDIKVKSDQGGTSHLSMKSDSKE